MGSHYHADQHAAPKLHRAAFNAKKDICTDLYLRPHSNRLLTSSPRCAVAVLSNPHSPQVTVSSAVLVQPVLSSHRHYGDFLELDYCQALGIKRYRLGSANRRN